MRNPTRLLAALAALLASSATPTTADFFGVTGTFFDVAVFAPSVDGPLHQCSGDCRLIENDTLLITVAIEADAPPIDGLWFQVFNDDAPGNLARLSGAGALGCGIRPSATTLTPEVQPFNAIFDFYQPNLSGGRQTTTFALTYPPGTLSELTFPDLLFFYRYRSVGGDWSPFQAREVLPLAQTDPPPTPGACQWVPELPGAGCDLCAPPQTGCLSFCGGATGLWFDPPTAFGFEFEMQSDAEFASILDFPIGFDQPFTVIVDGAALAGQFGPGDSVDLGSGVTQFRIVGLTPRVDPEQLDAFPVQLAFSAPTADFTMTPLIETPVPATSSTAIGFLAATFLALLAGLLIRASLR